MKDMPTFKAGGREWMLTVNVGTVKAVRAALNINLLDLLPSGDGPGVMAKLADPCILVDVLWVLCREQAEKVSLTDAQFGAMFDGESIEAATLALFHGIADFFPAARRDLLRKVLGKDREVRDAALALANQQLDDMKTTDLLAALQATTLSKPAIASPESSA